MSELLVIAKKFPFMQYLTAYQGHTVAMSMHGNITNEWLKRKTFFLIHEVL